MKFAVVGAGAIGAYVGACLERGGAEVALVARGAHLAAMQQNGVRIESERGSFTAHPLATGDMRAIGPVDAVILALKAHQIADVLGDLPALFHADTAVVSMQNGIPWWYFAGNGGPYDGHTIEAVDPGGRIAAAIANERVVGSVVYPAAEIAAPGVIKHIEGTRFQLGNPDRKPSERTQRIADAFIAGGLKAPIDEEIRAEIWLKVLGNAAFNPISALTRATLVEMADDALVEPLVREMMAESLAVAAALGVVPNVTIDKRIDGARRVGMHKSSMLQDAEARKPFETEAIIGAVVELGALTGVPVPATRHVYALVKLLERSLLAGR